MNKDKYLLGFLPFAAALLFAIIWIVTVLSVGTMAITYKIANAPTPLPSSTPTITPLSTATLAPSPTTEPPEPSQTAEESEATATFTREAETIVDTEPPLVEKSVTPEPVEPTNTEQPSNTPDITATRSAEAEENMLEMQERISQLFSEGWIDSVNGEYHTLPNYFDAWNQLDPSYRIQYADYSPSDFVVRANATWQTSNTSINTQNSGCGFLFREEEQGNFIIVYLGMDKRVHMRRYIDGEEIGEGVQSVLVPIDTPEGSAEIMLAVSGSKVTFFIDGEKWFDPQNFYLTYGDFGMVTVTGTNLGFGTLCEMSDIQLWTIETE